MIKVLFNTPNQNLSGGPPTHLFMLERALRNHVQVVPYEYGRKSDNETVWQKIFGRFRDLITTRRILLTNDVDIIHHNSAFDPRAIVRDVPLVWLAKRFKKPIFIKIHGSLPDAFTTESKIVTRCRNYVLKYATGFGVLSYAEKNEFEDEFPETKGKMHVVKNILKDTFYNVERKESEKPSVLFVSRFIKRKGVFDLLNAIPYVLEQKPSANFTFVGDGPDAAEFDRCVAAMNLQTNVKRLSAVTNTETSTYYSSAWVFAFPTHFPEGMPMVIAEAMAAGVPIVTTPTRFSRSYMKEGKHCLFTKYGDVHSIADAILTLLSDSELRVSLSEANRELSRTFSEVAVSREFTSIYKSILSIDTKYHGYTVVHTPNPTQHEEYV